MFDSNSQIGSSAPPWEDVLLYSLSVETRKRFEDAVHAAKTERRKKATLGDDFIFYSGNKAALPREEFCEFFRRILLKGYAILENEKQKLNENETSGGRLSTRGRHNDDDSDDGDDDDDGNKKNNLSFRVKRSTPKVSILATTLAQLNSQKHSRQQQQQPSKSFQQLQNTQHSARSRTSSSASMLGLSQQQQQRSGTFDQQMTNFNNSMTGGNTSFGNSFGGGMSPKAMSFQPHASISSFAMLDQPSSTSFDLYEMDVTKIGRDPQFRQIIHSIDRFLEIFFTIADAEKSGRLDWDRIVSMCEEIISSGGLKTLAGQRFDVDGNPVFNMDSPLMLDGSMTMKARGGGEVTFLDEQYDDNDDGTNTNDRQNGHTNTNKNHHSSSAASGKTKNAFLDELRAASEYDSIVGLACASMRVLRVMRYVGERNRSILPSAKMQLEMIKSRLNEAEAAAALSKRIKDPVQAVIASYAGPPPTRGEYGGSIVPPPPMYNSSALQLRPPICNMNQARFLLETPFNPSLQETCAVQPYAAASVSRLLYQPSCGMFTALCKDTNEVRFVGESQSFLQRLSLREQSKIESVCLWKTVAASKAMSHGAGSIFEACAFSCFLGLLDGTVQLYSLRDTRIGPGMRNTSLKLQTQCPSGYVVCSLHVPFAKPSSVLTGTSTGDLIHWNFDPHVVDDFMGGGGASETEVTHAQAAALKQLMVFRRALHQGPVMDLCTLGDVRMIDLTKFRHPGEEDDVFIFGGSGNDQAQSMDGDSPLANSQQRQQQQDQNRNNVNNNNNTTKANSNCHVVSVGFDGYACVSDVSNPAALRRFTHSAGLLCCATVSESVFSSAGFVNEPHIWDVRAGSSTKPTMKLYDPKRPHLASITSLSVMGHLLPPEDKDHAKKEQQAQQQHQQQSSSSSASSLFPPLISCDSLGRMNVWDLRVGKTLSSFDIHALIDEATDALPVQNNQAKNRSNSAHNNIKGPGFGSVSGSRPTSGSGARGGKNNNNKNSATSNNNSGNGAAELAQFSLKEHKFSEDTCRATISRRTGRIFVTSESRSSVAEFGSVTPIGQDPRGCFPSEAILAIAYIASLRVIVTAHVDVVIVWELSRSYGEGKQRKPQAGNFAWSNTLGLGENEKKPDESVYDFDDDEEAMKMMMFGQDGGGGSSSEFGVFGMASSASVFSDGKGGGGGGGFEANTKKKNNNNLDTDYEQSPFSILELHEFEAPDIEAAAAKLHREKVLFRDKNSHKPAILHPLLSKERLTAFTLHSRGNQYAVGTNQGRIFVCRIHGGEVLFQTERSVHPKPNTEIRWISSASAPSVYNGMMSNTTTNDDLGSEGGGHSTKFGNLLSMSPAKKKKDYSTATFGFGGREASGTYEYADDEENAGVQHMTKVKTADDEVRARPHLQQKTLLQDDSIVSIGSDDSVICVHTMRQQIVQMYPKGKPLTCHVSRHDVLSVVCDDAPFFYFCDPLVASSVPIVPKVELQHKEVKFPMTAMAVAPWLNVAYVGDSAGLIHCMAVKPHPLAEAGADAHLYSAMFHGGDASVNFHNINCNSPAISAIACHHVGSQTLQEFTLVVAGDDIGRVGWWRAMGEIEMVDDAAKEKIAKRRSSLSGGSLCVPVELMSKKLGDANNSNSEEGGGNKNNLSRLGAKKVSFLTSGKNSNHNNNVDSPRRNSGGKYNSSTNSHISMDSSNNLSSTTNSNKNSHNRNSKSPSKKNTPRFFVKPSLYWENSCKFHEGRITSITIFTKHDTEMSGLAAIWIAAAGADGRVSLVRASTGEFVALISASPASRLSALTSSSSMSKQQKEDDANAAKNILASGGSSSLMFSAAQRRKLLVSSQGKVGGGIFDDGGDPDAIPSDEEGPKSLRRKNTGLLSSSPSSSLSGAKKSFLGTSVFAASATKNFKRSITSASALSSRRSTSAGDANKNNSINNNNSATSLPKNPFITADGKRIMDSSRRDPSKIFQGTRRDFPLTVLFWMRRFLHQCKKKVHERRQRNSSNNNNKNNAENLYSFGFGSTAGGIGRSSLLLNDLGNTTSPLSNNNNATMKNAGADLGSTFSRQFSEAVGLYASNSDVNNNDDEMTMQESQNKNNNNQFFAGGGSGGRPRQKVASFVLPGEGAFKAFDENSEYENDNADDRSDERDDEEDEETEINNNYSNNSNDDDDLPVGNASTNSAAEFVKSLRVDNDLEGENDENGRKASFGDFGVTSKKKNINSNNNSLTRKSTEKPAKITTRKFGRTSSFSQVDTKLLDEIREKRRLSRSNSIIQHNNNNDDDEGETKRQQHQEHTADPETRTNNNVSGSDDNEKSGGKIVELFSSDRESKRTEGDETATPSSASEDDLFGWSKTTAPIDDDACPESSKNAQHLKKKSITSADDDDAEEARNNIPPIRDPNENTISGTSAISNASPEVSPTGVHLLHKNNVQTTSSPSSSIPKNQPGIRVYERSHQHLRSANDDDDEEFNKIMNRTTSTTNNSNNNKPTSSPKSHGLDDFLLSSPTSTARGGGGRIDSYSPTVSAGYNKYYPSSSTNSPSLNNNRKSSSSPAASAGNTQLDPKAIDIKLYTGSSTLRGSSGNNTTTSNFNSTKSFPDAFSASTMIHPNHNNYNNEHDNFGGTMMFHTMVNPAPPSATGQPISTHFGQTYSAGLMASIGTLHVAPPKKAKVLWSEMPAMHKFRTMRATKAIEVAENEQEGDKNLISAEINSNSNNNNNNLPVSPHHFNDNNIEDSEKYRYHQIPNEVKATIVKKHLSLTAANSTSKNKNGVVGDENNSNRDDDGENDALFYGIASSNQNQGHKTHGSPNSTNADIPLKDLDDGISPYSSRPNSARYLEKQQQNNNNNLQNLDHANHNTKNLLQTGALLAGPSQLDVRISQFLPSDRDRSEMCVFDDDDDDDYARENANFDENYKTKTVNDDLDIERGRFFDPRKKTHHQPHSRRSNNSPENNNNSSTSRSRSRSRKSTEVADFVGARPCSATKSEPGDESNQDDDDDDDNDLIIDEVTGQMMKRRKNRKHGKSPKLIQHFVHLSTQRKVPSRPSSAKVEGLINDVISNKFLLPESRERLGRRFAQSIVVSSNQRSYIPISAQSHAENTTSSFPSSLRPQSARLATSMRPGGSFMGRYSGNNINNINSSSLNSGGSAPPPAPTHLSPQTTAALFDNNIITNINSASAFVSNNNNNSNTSAIRTRSPNRGNTRNDASPGPSSSRPTSATINKFSAKHPQLASSARARNQYRHHGEQQIVRPSSSVSQLSTTSHASQQQQQYNVKKIVERIVNDPDSDMASRILPPTGNEVSARKAADVLHHTSARANELVLRKAAVEEEAKRFRFKYDVESRKKRELLLSRVHRMGDCIDEALTPVTLTSMAKNGNAKNIGSSLRHEQYSASVSNNNNNNNNTLFSSSTASASRNALSSSRNDREGVTAKNMSSQQNAHPERHWTPTADLVAWMSAPKSSVK